MKPSAENVFVVKKCFGMKEKIGWGQNVKNHFFTKPEKSHYTVYLNYDENIHRTVEKDS
jgi:hypothetical protein